MNGTIMVMQGLLDSVFVVVHNKVRQAMEQGRRPPLD